MEKVRPSRGWVVIQPIPLAEYAGTNLTLPDSVKSEQFGALRATVIAIGPPKYNAAGLEVEYNAEVGAVVMYRPSAAAALFGRPVAGEAYMLILDDHILAVVEPAETKES